MNEAVLNTILTIATSAAVMLIGVAGVWLQSKIGQNKKLGSLKIATDAAIAAAQITVLELQQTIVDKWKADAVNGKLTDDQIAQLGDMLQAKAIDKMSAPAIALLNAAQVDICALIAGAGEAWIKTIRGSSTVAEA